MDYYLYRHIRLDKNEPFYIGVARKRQNKNFKSLRYEHERAFVKSRPNNIWKSIARRSEYDVEIVYECDSESEILRKEIEFIKLYGRIDLNTGTLANLTDGGEGVNNPSEETRRKISSGLTGIKRSIQTRKKISENSKKQCREPLSNETKVKIGNKNRGVNNGMCGVVGRTNKKSKPVLQFNEDGDFLKEWSNAREIERVLGISYKHISAACLKRKYGYAKGFVWKYKERIDNYFPSRLHHADEIGMTIEEDSEARLRGDVK